MEPPKDDEGDYPGKGSLLEDIVTMGGARRDRRIKGEKAMDAYLKNQQEFEEVPETKSSGRHWEHR